MRAVLWFSAPIALVYAPINRFLRGTGESDFFIDFHLIPFHLSAALLADLLFDTRLLAYPYLPAPRPAILDTIGGEVHGCDTTDGWRDILLASGGDRWRRELMGCDIMLA